MQKVELLHSFGSIKLLADSRRMDILRQIMASPATLTQLARTMKKSPAWIRHHILALEAANLVEVGEIRKTGKVTEKFYRAKAHALLLQEIVLPKTKKRALIFAGSDDLAIEAIAEGIKPQVTLLSLSVGSLDGLVNLRQGLCHISGSHLLDENGEYNEPFIRHLFPDRQMQIVTLAHRTQGLMLDRRLRGKVRDITDIAALHLRFVNRNAGSGTRLWFDKELKHRGIPINKIPGYSNIVKTHTEAASLILKGEADVAVGLQAAAHQHDLEFIPLFEERYDLVFPGENEKALIPLLDYVQTTDFRVKLSQLPGYNSTHTGEHVSM